MILVTGFTTLERYYYFETEDQKNRALLAILTKAHKKFFAKDEITVDDRKIRYAFVTEDWEMAKLDDDVVKALPESMKKKIALNKNRYNHMMLHEERRVEVLKTLRQMMDMDIEEAVTLKMKDENGKNRPAVQVVADFLNGLVKERTNDGYTNDELFEIRKTEKY